MTDGWLVQLAKPPSPAMEILCFPWAGGGAAGFHSLKAHVGGDVSLWAVAPPGRQQRLSEPQEGDLRHWIEAIGPELDKLTARPRILFGHSFGAALAFELTHWLADQGRATVDLLCVSSRRAPGVPSRTPHLASAPDDEVVAWMRRLGGIEDEVLSCAEMLELVLPALRHDITLDVAYRPSARAALDIPILALAGRDDPIVRPAEMADWERRTRAAFELQVVPGNHFHLHARPARVLRLIREALDRSTGPHLTHSAERPGAGRRRGHRTTRWQSVRGRSPADADNCVADAGAVVGSPAE